MQRPIAPQMEPEISVQLLCHMDNLEDMDALSLGMRAVLRWATLETWITKTWEYKNTRGQGDLRFSRLNVCKYCFCRYGSYGSYNTPLIQREFE